MQRKDVYIIIPVFDHDAQLVELVHSIRKEGFDKVVVVNDGSAKDIYDNIRHLNVIYIAHKLNLGQGAALQTGFEFARRHQAMAVVCMDADGQHDPKDIRELLDPVLGGEADLALGSRFLSKQPVNMPASRRRMLRLARYINYLFTGVKLTDTHNGFRAMNARALDRISVTENRMAHATEIIWQARQNGLRIVEIPVTIHYSAYSRAHGQSAWNSIRIFFDLLFHKLFA